MAAGGNSRQVVRPVDHTPFRGAPPRHVGETKYHFVALSTTTPRVKELIKLSKSKHFTGDAAPCLYRGLRGPYVDKLIRYDALERRTNCCCEPSRRVFLAAAWPLLCDVVGPCRAFLAAEIVWSCCGAVPRLLSDN